MQTKSKTVKVHKAQMKTENKKLLLKNSKRTQTITEIYEHIGRKEVSVIRACGPKI